MNWNALLRAGLGRLGLAPGVFWDLTPVELALMLGVEPGPAAFTRARLEEICAAFPDAPQGSPTKEDMADGRS